MDEEALKQRVLDEEHLKLLSIGYMVSAGVSAFYSLFALIYVLLGAMLLFVPAGASGQGEPPPELMGLFIGGGGLVVFLLGLTLAGLKLRTGICLKQRRSLTFCQVIAGFSCLSLPYGTILGIFTFIVVGRPSVRQLFQESAIEVTK